MKNMMRCIAVCVLLAGVFPFVFAQSEFTDNLDNYDTGRWTKADGWTNGSPFNCYWRDTQITFSGGQLAITLDSYTGSPPWKSGEYRSNETYRYGFFECRMKASNHQGTVSSLFLYTGPSHDTIWDEIDIEILGKNPRQVQCNYFADSKGGHEHMVDLGFDSSAGFHNYGFEWQSSFIKWYIDGVLVHTINNNGQEFPVTSSMCMINYWNGDSSVTGWLGNFDQQVPQSIYYDWIRYLKTNPYTGTTPDPTPTVAPTITNPPGLRGDVNSSGTIDIVDALMVAQYYVGLNPGGFNMENADTNCNGTIDIVDALLIAQYYVGLINRFC
ncbi:MAG: family 16 glycosylhydrolase [Spirochaetales bacterium]|nr:family 16 glycosylhydrolase [Spirochaetales bacterium]